MGLTHAEMKKAVTKEVSPDFSRQTTNKNLTNMNVTRVPSLAATAISTFSIGTDLNKTR